MSRSTSTKSPKNATSSPKEPRTSQAPPKQLPLRTNHPPRAKRYERLIKAYNKAANETKTATGSEPDAAAAAASPDSSPKKTKTTKAGPPKKTKAKQEGENPSSGPSKRKVAGEGSKAGTKKARVSKESVVESAERMVEQRLSPVKEEEGSDAEEEKGDETAVDGEALFDQFCNSEGDGRIAVKEETEEVA